MEQTVLPLRCENRGSRAIPQSRRHRPKESKDAIEAGRHLFTNDVLSVPDNWEFPWYASWDLAFHTITLAMIDPEFAKAQLILLMREWYMHPNGQLPAYEWAFSDVNPPVHAWAAFRIFQIERRMKGKGDRKFLVRAFHKLLINFTWWVNRKDPRRHECFPGRISGAR